MTALATAVMDGRRIVVSGGGDKTVRLWDPAAGASVGEPLTGHLGAVTAVATTVLDERPHAVSAGMDGTARLWDLAAGRQVACLGRYPARDMSMPIWKLLLVAFAGPGLHQEFAVATAKAGADSVAIVGGADGAQVWDLATGEARGAPLTGDLVMKVATAELDGRPVVVTSGPVGPIRLWELDSGAPMGVLPEETGVNRMVAALAVGKNSGQTVILTTRFHSHQDRGTVQVWDPASCSPVGEPVEVGGPPPVMMGPMTVIVRDGRSCGVAAVGTPPGRARLVAWDLTTGERVGESQMFPFLVSALIPDPGGPEGSLVIGFGSEVAILNPC
ncbi:MAG: hypothetical protein HOV87_25155 [Catenulispora sp.]|nr:hypothetical protein [Catenulispora sp.]